MEKVPRLSKNLKEKHLNLSRTFPLFLVVWNAHITLL